MGIAKNLALQLPQLRRVHRALTDLRQENAYLLTRVHELEAANALAHVPADEAERLRTALNGANARLSESDARIYVLSSDLARLESELAAKAGWSAQDFASLVSERNDAKASEAELQQAVSRYLADVEALTFERDEARAAEARALEELEAHRVDIEALELERDVMASSEARKVAELDQLRDQSQAIEFERDQLKALEQSLYEQLHQSALDREALVAEIAELEARAAATEHERALALQSATTLERQNQVLHSDVARLTSARVAEQRAAETAIEEERSSRLALLEEHGELARQVKTYEAKLEAAAQALARLDEDNRALATEAADARREIADSQQTISRLEGEVVLELAARTAAEAREADLTTRLDGIVADLEAARARANVLEGERNVLISQISSLQDQIASFEARRASLEEAAAMSQRIAALSDLVVKSSDLDQLEGRLSAALSSSAELTRLETSLGSRLSLVRYGLDELARSTAGTGDSASSRRYLNLLEKSLVGELYDDPNMDPWSPADYDKDRRLIGRDWPRSAMTMIGTVRMRNIRALVEDVISEGVAGDLIETGVWRGGACIYMRGILAAHGISDRRVWVADSFAGLPPPDPTTYPADSGDAHHTYEDLVVSLDQVKANFAKYDLLDDQVVFLPGWFSDTLHTASINEISILRLDGDMYSSTMDALNALYAKVSPGGFVIVDDYILKPCRDAVEDFRKTHRISDPLQEVDGAAVYWRKSQGVRTRKVASRSRSAERGAD